MTSHNEVITSEALLAEFCNRIAYIVINQNWLRGIENKVWKADPNSLTFGSALSLNFLGQTLVRGVVTLHTVDPDDGDVVTRCNCWLHNDKFGVSDSCRCC